MHGETVKFTDKKSRIAERFEAFSALTMDIAVFLNVAPYNFVKVYRRFEETCCVPRESKS